VSCGQSVQIAAAGDFPIGTVISIVETVPATGGLVATVPPATLTAANQTITVNNAAAPAGALNISKTCPSGVSGSATFSITAPSPSGTGTVTLTGLSVGCGATVTVPTTGALAGALVVGAPVTITETEPPSGLLGAPAVPITLTGAAQTVTIKNGVPAGVLSIHKTCAPTVSGTATFSVMAPSPVGTGNTVTLTGLTVACGATATVPTTGTLAGALVVGAPVMITETTPATNGAVAGVQTLTLSAGANTVTINDAAVPAGTLSIQKTCSGGITGSATFSVVVTTAGLANPVTVPLTVACGQTLAVPIPEAASLVGGVAVIHETAAASGAVAAGDVTATLTAAAQTITINNAPPPPPPTVPGVLFLHKTCASGVTGSATFAVTVTPSVGSPIAVTVTVPCGGTVGVPLPSIPALLGAGVTIHETAAATGGSAAADVTTTLGASAQTITINNAAAVAAGGLTLQKVCGAGVTGSATFAVHITPPAGSGLTAVTVPLTLACGQTITVPVPVAAALAGTVVSFHETVPATGAVAATDVTTTLLGTAQTITITNVSAAGAGGVARLAQTGGATPSAAPGLSVLLLAMGAALIVLGRTLWIRRRA
jgi:hypothetical protein